MGTIIVIAIIGYIGYLLLAKSGDATSFPIIEEAIVSVSTDSFPLGTLIKEISYTQVLDYAHKVGKINIATLKARGKYIEFNVSIDSVEYFVTLTEEPNGDRAILKVKLADTHSNSYNKLDIDIHEEEMLSDILADLVSTYASLKDKTMITVSNYGSELGYGSTLNKIIDICKNINYLPTKEKATFLTKYSLTEPTVKNIISAVGTPAYYNEDTHEVIPEVPYSVNDIKVSISKLGQALDINLTECIIDTNTIDQHFRHSKNEAMTMYNNTEILLLDAEIMELITDYSK